MAPLLKSELHTHTSDDPQDYIPHTTADLVRRAAELEYRVLAITLHDRWFDARTIAPFAERAGLTVISGIERTIERKHVLLLNFGRDVERVESFQDLAAARRVNPGGVVIAPHPFYPVGHSLGRVLDRYPDLFDAIELNAFYVARMTRFNAAAVKWAERYHKPVVANADVHRLWQLGRTYSLVEAASSPEAICAALRAGDVEIRTAPLSMLEAGRHVIDLGVAELFRKPAERPPRR